MAGWSGDVGWGDVGKLGTVAVTALLISTEGAAHFFVVAGFVGRLVGIGGMLSLLIIPKRLSLRSSHHAHRDLRSTANRSRVSMGPTDERSSHVGSSRIA
jgi:hypothetical protein